MKKWLPAIFILAAALIFFGVISLPRYRAAAQPGGSPAMG